MKKLVPSAVFSYDEKQNTFKFDNSSEIYQNKYKGLLSDNRRVGD